MKPVSACLVQDMTSNRPFQRKPEDGSFSIHIFKRSFQIYIFKSPTLMILYKGSFEVDAASRSKND